MKELIFGPNVTPQDPNSFFDFDISILTLGDFIRRILANLAELNDLHRKGAEDASGICEVTEALLRNSFHQVKIVNAFIEKHFGHISLKFVFYDATCLYPDKPVALIFKPQPAVKLSKEEAHE